MTFKFSTSLVALTLFASAALADGITVTDPYARSSAMMASSGAAFMMLHNDTDQDDTLVAARADGVAERVELHTHIADDNGVMMMRQVEGGIAVPAHGEIALQRGGLHVMFLGLTEAFEQGDMLDVTLVFENAGEVPVQIPVDLERKPMHGKMDHSHGSHGNHGDHQMAPTSSN